MELIKKPHGKVDDQIVRDLSLKHEKQMISLQQDVRELVKNFEMESKKKTDDFVKLEVEYEKLKILVKEADLLRMQMMDHDKEISTLKLSERTLIEKLKEMQAGMQNQELIKIQDKINLDKNNEGFFLNIGLYLFQKFKRLKFMKEIFGKFVNAA